jgi:hypothetical protein
MLPLSVLNSLGRGRSLLRPVTERGSNEALRAPLFAEGRTRRGGSRLPARESFRSSVTEGGTLNHQLRLTLI